jgi:hypothetical protein
MTQVAAGGRNGAAQRRHRLRIDKSSAAKIIRESLANLSQCCKLFVVSVDTPEPGCMFC